MNVRRGDVILALYQRKATVNSTNRRSFVSSAASCSEYIDPNCDKISTSSPLSHSAAGGGGMGKGKGFVEARC
jgi:hypothetical protein